MGDRLGPNIYIYIYIHIYVYIYTYVHIIGLAPCYWAPPRPTIWRPLPPCGLPGCHAHLDWCPLHCYCTGEAWNGPRYTCTAWPHFRCPTQTHEPHSYTPKGRALNYKSKFWFYLNHTVLDLRLGTAVVWCPDLLRPLHHVVFNCPNVLIYLGGEIAQLVKAQGWWHWGQGQNLIIVITFSCTAIHFLLCLTYIVIKGQFLSCHTYILWEVKDHFSW